jgi:hypothetical protein
MDTHDGPVVIGHDGGPGAAHALALGVGWAGELGSPAMVLTVYPGPAPISPGRVDAEWVADRRAEAEHLLQEARGLTSTQQVEFRAVGSGRPPTDYSCVNSTYPASSCRDLADGLDC